MNEITLPADVSRGRPVRTGPMLHGLPLVTLYLSERCNSRCVTCDYWRNGRNDMNLATVRELLPGLAALRTRMVLLSGGEPLLNPEWLPIAQMLRAAGLKLWLLTSGLSLGKHARIAATVFDSITVSMDGTVPETYEAIRGLDAFEHVCAGIRLARSQGADVTLRVTLQRANYEELPRFVDLAHELDVRQISFLAVDVANPHAFARKEGALDVAPGLDDLPRFERLLNVLERDREADFRSGFIAESPGKMRRLLAYFAAVRGAGDYPPVRCNAAEFSAVIDSHGRVNPCFFIPGPAAAVLPGDLDRLVNIESMVELRDAIRAGRRSECSTCVCSLWRDPCDFEHFRHV